MELHCQIQFRRLCTLVVLSAVLFGAAESQAAKNATAKLRDSPVITVPNRRIGSIFDSVSNAFGNAMTNTRPPYLSQYSRNQTYSDGFSNRYAQPSSIFTFPQGKLDHLQLQSTVSLQYVNSSYCKYDSRLHTYRYFGLSGGNKLIRLMYY